MKHVILLGLLIGLSTLAFSQQQASQQGPSSWYLQINELNADTYGDFQVALRAHPAFELREACSPAHVAVIGLKATAPAGTGFSQLTSLLAQKGFGSVSQLPSPGSEAFLQRCHQARLGQ